MSFRVLLSVSLHLISIIFCLILSLLCHSLLALFGETFSLASHDCFTALMIKYGHHHYLSRDDVFIKYIKLCRQYSIIKIIHQILNTLQLVSAKINQLQYKISSVGQTRITDDVDNILSVFCPHYLVNERHVEDMPYDKM